MTNEHPENRRLDVADVRIGQRSGGFESLLFSRVTRLTIPDPQGEVRTRSFALPGIGLRLSRVTSTGHDITLEEDRNISVVLPGAGGLTVRLGRREEAATAGVMLWMMPNPRRTTVAPPSGQAYKADLLTFGPDSLIRMQEAADAGHCLPDLSALGGPQVQGLRCHVALSIERVLAGRPLAPRGPEALSAWLEDLLTGILQARGLNPASPPCLPSLRKMRLVEEILRDRHEEPLSIADVARQVQIGLRSVELDFQAVHGVTPRDYLTRIRLEHAHNRLLAGDVSDSVTRIALDCGFTHLGRFAGIYGARYGETPRQTLARAVPVRRRGP